MTQQQIDKHKFVQFTYSITDQQSNILEQVDIPMSYVHGTDSGLLEKVERALRGHKVGDRVSVKLSPDEGFGPHHREMTYIDDIQNVPEQFRRLGAEVQMQNDRGETKTFRVSKIENGKLTVDGNHPLAGKTLIFTIDVRDIRDATPEEIVQGRPAGDMLMH
ncbi:MAG: peptidylprolyl isomerase [Pseudomonadota bacterium]